MAKKKKEKSHFGKYYFQGDADKKQRAMICAMIKDGVTVYHQFGKPPGCPPGGCH